MATGSRKFGFALLTTSALITSGVARADTPPPQFTSIDQNGVDLVSGLPFVSIDEGGIGSAEGALRMRRTWSTGSGWADNWSGGLFAVTSGGVTKTYVQWSGLSDVFTQSGSTYSSDQAEGATLTTLPGGNFLYTSRDGTKIEFLATPSDRQVAPCSGADANTCRVPLTVTRPNGLKFTFTYDTALTVFKRLASVTSSAGYSFTVTYATNNAGTGSQPVPNWFVRTLVTFNNSVNPPNPAPTITYVADISSGDVTVTDTGGRTWRFNLDGSGFLKRIERPATSQHDNIVYRYDLNNIVDRVTKDGIVTNYARVVSGTTATTTITDPLNHDFVAVADLTKGRVASVTDATNKTTSYLYDANARPTRVTREEGNYTELVYDARGNITTTTSVAKGGSGLSNIVTSASYDATCSNVVKCNKPNSTTDAKGNVTDYTYDATHGGLLTVTRPAPTVGAVRPQALYSYTQITSASGDLVYQLTGTSACQMTSSCTGLSDETKTVMAYNSNLLPTSVSRGDGTGVLTATTTTTYDSHGNVDTVDGPLAGTADTTKYRYDSADQLTGVTSPDPDGASALKMRAARYTYLLNGQLSKQELGTVDSQSDPDWALFNPQQTIDLTYNNDSRLLTRQVSAGGTVYALNQYRYDANGRLDCTAVRMNLSSNPTDACTQGTLGSFGADRITQLGYDQAGRITKKTVGVGTTDVADERVLTYTRNGFVATLKDGENRQTTFEYDGFDRLKKTRFPQPGGGGSSTTDYEQLTYDANSNVTTRRLRDTNSIGFTFDNLDRPTLKDLPGSEPDVSYGYDNLGRLTLASQTGNALSSTYDALSRKLTEVGPQGTLSFGYDLAGRKTSIVYPGSTSLTINYAYLLTGELNTIKQSTTTLVTNGYDNLGNRTSSAFGNITSQAFTYDSVSRLASLTNNLLSTANDLTTTFAYNPANQITSTVRTGDVYAWTGHGNGSTAYVANGLNELTSVGGSAATWDSKGNLTSEPQSGKTYGYSSENLLTSASGGVTLAYAPGLRLYQVAGASTTRLAYDGANAIAEYSGSNALQRRFVFDPTTGQPVLWYEGTGTGSTNRRYLGQDERGSVISVSDFTGAPLRINTYDEYGKPGANNLGRYQYTGQKWIPEIGAYDYKARMYAAQLGRFMQTDPIGYGPSPNLYAYVGNDPVNFVDPTGLVANSDSSAPCDPTQVGGSCAEVIINGSGGGTSLFWFPIACWAGCTNTTFDLTSNGDDDEIVVIGVRPPPETDEGGEIIVTAPKPPVFVPVAAPKGPRYDPTHNYCGAEGGQRYPQGTWNEACYHHDRCYSTVGSSRLSCDWTLRQEIFFMCAGRGYSTPQSCSSIALVYFLAVQAGARDAYRRAQGL